MRNREQVIRDRIKSGQVVSSVDVTFLALSELELARIGFNSSEVVADHHIKMAETYARLAQAMKH